jgi:hypothetical protein
MTMHTRTFIGAAAGLAAGAVLTMLAGPWALAAQNARQDTSNTVVNCEPGERVVVRHAVVNNELQVATECVTRSVTAARFQDSALTDRSTRPAGTTRTTAARAKSSALPTTSPRVDEKKHDWAQTALIIGGSAGAGAGIGAMANGKKGALIGAAVGGGAAALVEAIRR